MEIIIGDLVFNSKTEALRHYRNILHHSTVPMSYHDSRDILRLISTADLNFYTTICGHGGKNIDYIYVSRKNTPTVTLKLLDKKQVRISIYKLAHKCYKISLKAHAEKTGNKGTLKKLYEEEIVERSKKGTSCRRYFNEACRSSIHSHRPEKERYCEAHHANEGGFAQIVSDFIQEFNIDVNQPIYTVVATDSVRFTDVELSRKFVEFHDSRVEWQIVTKKQHKQLHG